MMLIEESPVPDAALPVADFAAHLRLGTGFADDGLQDALLGRHLRAAMAAIEARTGKILIERAFSWRIGGWADAGAQPLPVAPVSAVADVVLIDRTGVETPLAADDWRLEPDMQRPRLLPAGACLPGVPAGGAVRIGFLAGFGPDWSDLPSDLGHAAMLLAAHFHEYRHEAGDALPYSVNALIGRYRTVRLLAGSRA